MPKEVTQSWFFSQSPEEVWEYLTRPELIELWLSKTDFQPVAGKKFHFADKSGKIIYCEVLEVKPFSRLSYSWQFHSAKGAKIVDSQVLWTLIPTGDGTELHLQHDGFSLLEDLTAHRNGWNTCLERFKQLLKANRDASTNT